MHCQVVTCRQSDTGSVCDRGCREGGRHRRESKAFIMDKEVFLSLGPVSFQDKIKGEDNKQLIHWFTQFVILNLNRLTITSKNNICTRSYTSCGTNKPWETHKIFYVFLFPSVTCNAVVIIPATDLSSLGYKFLLFGLHFHDHEKGLLTFITDSAILSKRAWEKPFPLRISQSHVIFSVSLHILNL